MNPRRTARSLLVLFVLAALPSESRALKPVATQHGMVVSSESRASEAGVEIMQAGGNAVDAAVAVGFALAVTYPFAGNIGGGGFMVIRLASGEATVVDYRQEAPARSSRDMYLDARGNLVPEKSTVGGLSVATPGTVAGLALAEQKVAHASNGEDKAHKQDLDLLKMMYGAIDTTTLAYPTELLRAADLPKRIDLGGLTAVIEFPVAPPRTS